ncbi:MAG: acylphosphatase [Acidobacteriota bacterium]
MLARYFIIKGRVQGVGFRFFAYEAAQQMGIKGWTKNLENGDVEIHAQGDEQEMAQFLNRIRSGPPLSVVSDIEVREVAADQNYSDFSIER